MKNIKSFNEEFNERLIVEVEIPKSIIAICERHNIPQQNIKEVFSNYIDHVLGTTYGVETEGFEIYCEESDNITDYVDDLFNIKNI